MPDDEVIVVNNNGTDQTPEVINGFQQLLPIKYVVEPKQGLANARNCALTNASNDVIIFFDDDVTVLPGCLTRYRAAALEHKDIGFFGGKITVDWQGAQPGWYRGERLPMLDGLIGRYDPIGDTITYPPEMHLPFGANFAVRRTLVDAIGVFNPALGVKGRSIARGEESDFFQRALQADMAGRYLRKAKVGHRFQIERLSVPYLFRYGIQKGLMASCQDQRVWFWSALSQIVRGLVQLSLSRRDRFYQCVINAGVYKGRSKADRALSQNHD